MFASLRGNLPLLRNASLSISACLPSPCRAFGVGVSRSPALEGALEPLVCEVPGVGESEETDPHDTLDPPPPRGGEATARVGSIFEAKPQGFPNAAKKFRSSRDGGDTTSSACACSSAPNTGAALTQT